MLITKGKCDAEGCGREFEPSNGGFLFSLNVENDQTGSKFLTLTIARINLDSTDDTFTVCGMECLMKVVQAACDQHLEQTVGSAITI